MLMSFFFNDTATTEIYTLSLHDALPIFERLRTVGATVTEVPGVHGNTVHVTLPGQHRRWTLTPQVNLENSRSEEHTSELQSRQYFVCRLLLENKTNVQQCCDIVLHQLPT